MPADSDTYQQGAVMDEKMTVMVPTKIMGYNLGIGGRWVKAPTRTRNIFPPTRCVGIDLYECSRNLICV